WGSSGKLISTTAVPW
nr:Chain E, HIV-1 gp41 immunodominant region [HIV-1 06TG.HT008]7N08_F Chain F, HIV-1 gp41 immunodominant region [HIV-1 06TG.HT008]7N08_G Chain G, HIV-1 gp41 immunodominant region [HIV-1 06TG.HT008]